MAGSFLLLALHIPSYILPLATRPATVSRAALSPRMEAPPADPPQPTGFEGMEGVVADDTYELMLKTLKETDNSLAAQISANYAMFDYGFLQKLCACPCAPHFS